MLKSPHAEIPPLALGMASIVLGTIGLALFLLPILGISLGACGLLLGTADLVFAAFGHRSRLRWALVGVVVSSVAVGTGLAIAFAPLGYEPSHAVPRPWQTPPDRPYVPPPARPGRVSRAAEDATVRHTVCM